MGINLIVVFLLTFTAQNVSGSGRFITTLLSYTEFQPLTSLGEVCDSSRSLPCDRFYLIKISPEASTTILLETPVISGTNFETLPSFLVKMDTMTSVSYEIAIFDRDDGNPSPLRTQSSSLGVVAVNGFDLDSTKSPTTLSVNTSESFHGITFQIEVECDKNFYGPRCDKMCVPKDGPDGHFSCGKDGQMVCNSGFENTAQNCMVSVSPCANSPCLNGGVCSVSTANTAQCQCAPGFTGDFCNRRISACDCNPCSNGGVCVEANTLQGFACECTFGWTGELCQDDFDECTLRTSCPSGVSCINTPGSFTCCIGIPGPTPLPSNLRRIPITPSTTRSTTPPPTAAPQPTTTTVRASVQTQRTPSPRTPAPAATRPQTPAPTQAPVNVITQPTTPRRFVSRQTPSTRAPAVTQPTTPPRFVTQAPVPVTPAPNPAPAVAQPSTPPPAQSRFFGQQTTPSPAAVTQPSATPASVPAPAVSGLQAHCGNPSTQLRTILVQNLQVLLQQKLYKATTVNLQRVATNPTAFANYVRNKCGVVIVGRIFANPSGPEQISCLLTEINNCLFGSSSIAQPANAQGVDPPAPTRANDPGTGNRANDAGAGQY